MVTDAAGNITNDGLGHTYVYNQAGHLAQVLHGATLIATYVYDYRGFRTRKVTTAAAPQGAQVVRYVYDEAGHLVAEVGATGAAIRSYIWADDKLYAQIDHTPMSERIRLAGSTRWVLIGFINSQLVKYLINHQLLPVVAHQHQ